MSLPETYYIPDINKERFSVHYCISASKNEAKKIAEDIIIEQTVEFPRDLVPPGDIPDHIFGSLDEFYEVEKNKYMSKISYLVQSAGSEFTQFINLIFGNISLKPFIRLEKIILSKGLEKIFKGPSFGEEGIRKLMGIDNRPLLCTALKPMGLNPKELGRLAYTFALAGMDFIKDDHGIANQSFSTFKERVEICSEEVRKANEKTGGHSLYMANITGPFNEIFKRALHTRKVGGGALLICPGLTGYDVVKELSENKDVQLPIMIHPAFLGSYAITSESGISHYCLYGQFARLAGGDATIYPNFGGRFSFTKEECQKIVKGSKEDMGYLKGIFPAPGGGMTLEKLPDLMDFYGKHVIYLIGGNLHRGESLLETTKLFRKMVEQNSFTNL